MTSGIFLIQDGGKLVRMDEAAYDSEDLLQGLLEDYPDLLAGDQMESSDPRRWLFVCREMGIPDEEQGGDRWSVDHLFLGQDAIPTLVEVKRSSDTRIRREVVGQMLDYAANAVVYWPVEQLRSRFEWQCESRNLDADDLLSQFLGESGDVEGFWQQAKTNLQAGIVRLVFIADVIPYELKRIVEFLNEQMDPAQVLAVELKQYVGENLRSLVPRVIGQTAEAETRKRSGRDRRKWDKASFFEELQRRKGAKQAHVARRLFDWARTKTDKFIWGKGVHDGSVYPVLDNEQGKQRVFVLWTVGDVRIPSQPSSAMSSIEPVDRDDVIRELHELLPHPVREEQQLDGSLTLIGGDPGEVIVRLSGSEVSIAVYSVRWEGPHTPLVCPQQIAVLNWRRLPASATMISLNGLVRAAVEMRRVKYRKCERCGETNPPEWMNSDGICQSCAEQHLGVVY